MHIVNSFPTKTGAENWIKENNIETATIIEGKANRSDPKFVCKNFKIAVTHQEYQRKYKFFYEK